MWKSWAFPRRAMSRSSSTQWIELLGRSTTWSTWGMVVTTIVATIVFTFGNLVLVMTAPVLTLVMNTLFTMVIFVLVAGLARLLEGRARETLAGVIVGVGLLALSGIRGWGLEWVADVSGAEDDLAAGFRVIVSISVFAPGLVLSVLIVELVRQWRRNQSEIEVLSEQRERTLDTVKAAVDAYLSDLSDWVRSEIEPTLRSIPSLNSAEARQSLKNIINSIVKPVSTTLHSPQAALVGPPPSPTKRIALSNFITLALKDAPLAPGLTGLIFGLTLLPRNLASGTVLDGLGATMALGACIAIGTIGINQMSRRVFTSLPIWLHLGLLSLLLSILGSLIAFLSQLVTGSTLGFDNVFIVGAAATVTLSVLLGGVVNATKYVAQQQRDISVLQSDLDREVEAARRLQWQRHRSLGNMLHGPLQAALNAGSIKLSRATTPDQVKETSEWLTREVTTLLDQIPSLDNTSPHLTLTMQRITDTWEGICKITWSVDDSLADSLVGETASGALADVLVEAVFNAIKHQSPDHAVVEIIEEESGRIRLTVSHPGMLLAMSRPGVGTQTFQSLTSSFEWKEEGGNVVFEAVFYR